MNNIQKFSQVLNEGISQERLADILCHRLESRYPDIYNKYDYDKVYNTIDDVASFHAGAEELGSSDINIMLRRVISNLESSQDVSEGWKSALAGGALALGALGAHAGGVTLGGGGHTVDDQIRMNQQMSQRAQQQNLSGFTDEYLQKAADPNRFGRFLVTPEDAKEELELRAQGKSKYNPPQASNQTSSGNASGFSKEYLQKAADPNRFGRYLISIEKAQELLGQMKESRKAKQGVAEVTGLSTEKLAQYKTAAAADARAADKAGDYKRGDKRFIGINKATLKQFDNDAKTKKESAIMKGIQNETLGLPYPGTYEQENDPFKRRGQERTMKIAFEGKKNVSRRT